MDNLVLPITPHKTTIDREVRDGVPYVNVRTGKAVTSGIDVMAKYREDCVNEWCAEWLENLYRAPLLPEYRGLAGICGEYSRSQYPMKALLRWEKGTEFDRILSIAVRLEKSGLLYVRSMGLITFFVKTTQPQDQVAAMGLQGALLRK